MATGFGWVFVERLKVSESKQGFIGLLGDNAEARLEHRKPESRIATIQ